MADESRTFSPSKVQANRARMQGLGVGQSEMDLQQDPSRDREATARERPESFDTEAGFNQSGDRPASADDGDGDGPARSDRSEPRSFDTAPDPHMVGTPANVDPHNLGEGDNPELDWGDSEPGAVHSATHTRRPVKTEAERGQGPKTRSRNKQIVSGRPYG